MAVKHESNPPISDQLWDTFTPTPRAWWRTPAIYVALLAVPVLAGLAARSGVVRPNLDLGSDPPRFTYDVNTSIAEVDWNVANDGIRTVTVEAIAIGGIAPLERVDVNVPGGEQVTVHQRYQLTEANCASGGEEPVVRYRGWFGDATSTIRGLSIGVCGFVRS